MTDRTPLRPEVLWPLFASVEKLDGIGPKTAVAMAPAIEKVRDLLFTLPQSVVDRRLRDDLAGVQLPGVITLRVTVLSHQPPNAKGRPYRVMTRAGDDLVTLVFFHARGDYLEKQLPVGSQRIVSGKAESFDNGAQMVHPDHMLGVDDAGQLPDFEPVYPLHGGVSQKVMARAATSALARVPQVVEWIDPALVHREGWPDWSDSLHRAHHPQGYSDIDPHSPARQRLAYDELFAHQLTLAMARARRRKQAGVATSGDNRLWSCVLAALPYQPTGAQTRALAEIRADMAQPLRMNRLLQGDVGAGKTLVALGAMLTVVEAGGQAAMMAPTEILARQHYQSLAPLAEAVGVRVALLTGRDKGRARQALLDDLAAGQIDILLGTHALFQPDVVFHDLRLAIVDEQHRFGVAQRLELSSKGAADVLVMTATPIPRSLALAQYGDMDLSVLDEKPAGRQPVQTALVDNRRLDEVIGHLQRALAAGQQAYWVCPLVDESEVSDLTATEARFAQLRARLGDGVVGMVHGQMPPADKDRAMAAFEAGETRLLVATTVIEVGVNVPNASIMVIERAEAFGLAQLHQLRGRVGRGSAKSSCLLLYQAPLSDSGRRRLDIMRETEDGFRIAEEDMAIRGAGDVIGTAQSGLPRFRIADLERQPKLMQIAQSDARNLLNSDPNLTSPRGQAARVLLWLMERDVAFRLISVG
ncbi:ATP-dependent DNA helicase RecG [Ketogulonicigenium vulgare]|uniref:Probable DNA 3'-5' helicase RecG n=1 Tax=Ketogulonicigenium vulgare (strain WSH-001) TaxID=759362 RepID=F9Y6C7_KETVW|nr:ATP-dependent DNA helicase RecG [Ketogulonicigenium vulgare]AEM40873.1 ATP-dependent DNA helicase RecG [Ketogulonicigenium vulgare WSH-001]ALJ81032.1 ATP-dependent DNA helicase RecG [Ketogulonicigenium vulgare]ANW33789.1 ATP-dependent DNA helicase RecG [Ketogulonicigenium vulgare]AOZ54590.1 DEAD/DEAH box helicase domain protein [Ketogulonicigenium vulgare]